MPGNFTNGVGSKIALKKKGFLFSLVKHKSLFIMLIPAVLYFVIFSYIPMAGTVLAFKRYNFRDGIFFSPWVGLDNFKFFFLSGKAWTVIRNTALYNIAFIGLGTVCSVSLAVMLAEIKNRLFRRASQSIILLPHFISWVIVSIFVYNIFSYKSGNFNAILNSFGLQPIDIYSKTWYWFFLLPVFYIWKTVGYSSVLYLASIMGISNEFYEAAIIDGANIFQRIRYITIPLLKPTIITLVLLALSHVFRGQFDMFYQIIGKNGNLYNGTDIIDTFVFRSIIDNPDVGMSSAASVLQSFINFIFIMVVNRIVRKISLEYALF